MKFGEINPYIRFAEYMYIKRKPARFNVFDCRIFYIVSGEAEITIENNKYILKESDVFYCAGGMVYTIGCNTGCELLCLNFDLTNDRSNITESRAPLKSDPKKPPRYKVENNIEDCDFLNSFCVLKNSYNLNAKIKSIIEEFEKSQRFYREKSSAILKDLLADMYREELKRSENSSNAVENVISYINANFKEKIINSDLAKLTGYHEYYLNRIFKKQTGMTIHKYILQVRLSEARKLLLTTDIPLHSIAEMTGFGSDTHLSNCFKNYFCYSPMDYKNSFKNRI